MATVIRATDAKLGTASVAFNFDDMAAEAKSHLDHVRAEAVEDRRPGPAGGRRDPPPCRA